MIPPVANHLTSITILGPVQSGKTTYFAALWWLLNNQDGEHRYSVVIDAFKGNHKHLNGLAERWLNVQKIDHTDMRDWHDMTMHLRQVETGKKISLTIPDLPGEYVEHTLMHREWKAEVANYIDNSHGLIIFVNVDKVTPPIFLEEFLEFTENGDEEDSELDISEDDTSDGEDSGAELLFSGQEEASSIDESEAWEASIKKVPIDVYLTDVIQQIHYQYPQRVYVVSVILTGWDTVTTLRAQNPGAVEAQHEPEEWMRKKLPLLSCFLESHSRFFQVEIYGMSAYGGEQNRSAERKRIKTLVPHDRVNVTVGSKTSKDIALPLLPFFNLTP